MITSTNTMNKEIWEEKKEKNPEFCKEIIRFAEIQIMKWVNPQICLSKRDIRKIRITNRLLIESGIVSEPVTFESLVMLVQSA